MKLTIYLFLISLLQIHANSYSQSARITLDLDNVSIENVLRTIEEQSDFKFLYNDNEVDYRKMVSVKFKKTKIDKILSELFDGTNIDFEVLDKQIILVLEDNPQLEINSLQKTITGKVIDEDGFGVPGANIVIKGTSKGTVTDFDGNFTIEAAPSDILEISFIGYLTQSVTVGNQTNISIQLVEDAAKLDEVVVVGYGTAKRSDLTGALTSVSSKDFDKQPLSDVSQALQGRAAGVQVTQNTGAPGGGYKIRIRGANSITSNNDPLYVVDGQFVDISTVNVNDIASMEVLKDASATAIYGTRGANGVVLITTKSGSTGRPKVSVDVFTGFSNVTQKLNLMNAADFAEGVNYSENTEVFTAQEIADLRANGGEDWQELLFTTGYFNNVQLSASGGGNDVNYYISGNYYDESGTVIDQLYKRLNLRANLNANLSEKIKVGLNLNTGREVDTGVRANLGVGLAFDPTTFAFDENGNYNYNSENNLATSETNPIIAVENNSRRNVLDRLSINGNLNWDITDNLVFNTSGGIAKTDRHNNSYSPKIVSTLGRANVDNIYATNLYNTNRLTYSPNIGDNATLKIDAIHELVIEKRNVVEIDASDFFTDVVTYKDLNAANVNNYRVNNSEANRELESFLGRVNFSLFDKYLFTASFRADGSSVFQKDKWGYFPSGSVAWKISEEDFLKDSDNISNLKLRLSYGQVGNQGIGVFGTRARAILSSGVNYPYDGVFTTGAAPSNRIANPDLTWETTEQINAGLDLGLFNSALTFSFDYYKKNTTDLLLDVQLPEFVGPEFKFINAGEVENKGFEITLGTRILQNEDWSINSTLSVTSNKNKVISLNDNREFIYEGEEFRDIRPTRVQVGLPISSLIGYVFEGVYQLGEETEAAAFGRAPGDARYKDINDDGVITTDDITVIGDPNPDFIWGWNWDVSFKNWNLNFLLTGSQGNDIYNLQKGRLMALGPQQFHAVHGDYANRWTPTNPSNIPAGRNGTQYLSSQFIEDGSYITMKNIALSYNFNNNILTKLGMSNARVYASVSNLFIITDYTGFDPEATLSVENQDADVGIDYNSYPINRAVTFGLNVTF